MSIQIDFIDGKRSLVTCENYVIDEAKIIVEKNGSFVYYPFTSIKRIEVIL